MVRGVRMNNNENARSINIAKRQNQLIATNQKIYIEKEPNAIYNSSLKPTAAATARAASVAKHGEKTPAFMRIYNRKNRAK